MQSFRPENGKLSAEEKLNLLVEFGARISCELRLDKLLDIIAQQITKMLDVGRCTIYLKDVEKNELWSKIAQGRGLEHTEIRVPLNGNGVISLVARTGETINLPNAYEDPRFSMDVDMVTDFRTHSMLAIPLKNNSGKVLGVFQVANKADGTPLTKRTREFYSCLLPWRVARLKSPNCTKTSTSRSWKPFTAWPLPPNTATSRTPAPT